MRFLTLTLFTLLFATSNNIKKHTSDAMADAQIVAGSKHCNTGWNAVDIKNNSSSNFLTVTIQISGSRAGKPVPVTTQVFEKLAPKEQRELGCSGCGNTTSGQLCNDYRVIAAVYAQ